MNIKNGWMILLGGMICSSGLSGCTVKAVGDPNRPITINAHITLDIKGLKDSASSIEDFVSQGKTPSEPSKDKSTESGGNK